MSKFYITAAIPYVNAQPHVGHALGFVYSDTVARYQKLKGNDVLLLCGGDENALKNVQAAEKEGEEVQPFVDKNNLLFVELTKKLNCDFDVWQKGSDQKHHFTSSQKLWELCEKNGDIYKKEYTGLYCVGCETFYTNDELDEKGECFEHPGKKLEEVKEENYFFKLSSYQKQITDLIKTDALKITPNKRKNEMLGFLKEPLQDISISRSNKRAKNWGVPVPGDPTQRMYVWFDALNIYQSGIGFGWDEEKYNKWWPADVHVIGKGIIRFHAIYWPAFLLSAKLALPKELFVHEYFTLNGQKISKSLGNVIDPIGLIETYGADALRFYLLKHFSPFSDGDFSEEKFKEAYNADLANGLGNLVARVAKLAENNAIIVEDHKSALPTKEYEEYLQGFEFNLALEKLWKDIKDVDVAINKEEPWKLSSEEAIPKLKNYINAIKDIAIALKPFLPESAKIIEEQFSGKITVQKPLFPRI